MLRSNAMTPTHQNHYRFTEMNIIIITFFSYPLLLDQFIYLNENCFSLYNPIKCQCLFSLNNNCNDIDSYAQSQNTKSDYSEKKKKQKK